MRLLEIDLVSKSIQSKKLFGNKIPPYAILSHTWGADSDEFNFKDLMSGGGTEKAGYNKIRFCGEQAHKDGLQYFWVDTCCIDKSDSVELQEAINSMYQWYQDAEKCYVYLADVSSPRMGTDGGYSGDSLSWEPSFRKSKWFTRGWTLQELLAPHSVEFFSMEDVRLGDKRSLELLINEITGISTYALRGCPLSVFSIEQRFGWAKHRETTRGEDWAYSLLGIFDIFMPLIYGEGRDNAVIRLRIQIKEASSRLTELEKSLPHIEGLPLNLFARKDKIYNSLLQRAFTKYKRSPYSSRTKDDLYNILNSLLGTISILFTPLSSKALSNLLSLREEDMGMLLEELGGILNIPSELDDPLRFHDPSFRDFLYNKHRCEETALVVKEETVHLLMARNCVKVMEDSLKQDICGFKSPSVLASSMAKDRLNVYLQEEVQYACIYWVQHLEKGLAKVQPGSEFVNFVKVHLLHWIEALGWIGRLDSAIGTLVTLESIPWGIPASTLLSLLQDARQVVTYFKSSIQESPLQIYCSALLFTPKMSVLRKQFADCMPKWVQEIPMVGKNWNPSWYLKPSATRKYLLEEAAGFPLDTFSLISNRHYDSDMLKRALAMEMKGELDGARSTRMMFSPNGEFLATAKTLKLKKTKGSSKHTTNIQLLEVSSGKSLPEIRLDDKSVGAMAFSHDSQQLAIGGYVWIHLLDSSTLKERKKYKWAGSPYYPPNNIAFSPDGGLLALSWRTGYLKLLDMLSGYCRDSQENDVNIDKFNSRAITFSPDGKQLARVSERTLQVWNVASLALVREFKIHANHCGLVWFTPDRLNLAVCLGKDVAEYRDIGWTKAEEDIVGHGAPVHIMVSSTTGALASASKDNTIKLWNIGTGQETVTLKGHLDRITGLAFSPDGKRLGSSSKDHSIRVWDTHCGEEQFILECKVAIHSVAFSPDGTQVAGGLEVGDLGRAAFRIWDVTMKDDKTDVRFWRKKEGPRKSSKKIELPWLAPRITCLAFSRDHNRLPASVAGEFLTLWGISSKKRGEQSIEIFIERGQEVLAMAYSPDSSLLAVASSNNQISLWWLESKEELCMLDVGAPLRSLRFISDHCLETDRGYITISHVGWRIHMQIQGSASGDFFLRSGWIIKDGKHLLWLPEHYQGRCSAVSGDILVIGQGSGEVTFLNLRSLRNVE